MYVANDFIIQSHTYIIYTITDIYIGVLYNHNYSYITYTITNI